MNRNYDEILAEMLIQLDLIEQRMQKADKRMDLTIKRLVRVENRLEAFDKKIDQSLKDQREFSRMQSRVNKYFLDFIKKNPLK